VSDHFAKGLKPLSSKEKFEFKQALLIFGNLAILAWVLLASLSLFTFSQWYGWLFLLFAAAIVFLILRRTGCRSCYYCKSCTSGFGRLAGWFFGNRSTKDLNNKTALGLVVFSYVLLSLIPVALLVISLFQGFILLNSLVLLCLAALTIYSLTTWLRIRRKKPAT
jgi:uncharacterized membrane protein